jgi:hypothetical protein
MTDTMPAGRASTRDPFNWPSQGRADTMSLSTMHPVKDIVETRTKAYREKVRDQSDNLNTRDIEGM